MIFKFFDAYFSRRKLEGKNVRIRLLKKHLASFPAHLKEIQLVADLVELQEKKVSRTFELFFNLKQHNF